MKILTSKNYKEFRFLKGNRPLVASKIKKLVDAVTGGLNLFEYCPILVNQDMYVIDGQHRLEACKKLQLPVYYAVVPKISLLDIAKLNSASSKWSTADFFNCFIQTGNKDYEVLKAFKDKYHLSITDAVSLLMEGTVVVGGGKSGYFAEGKFQVRHKDKAEKIMKHVTDYSTVAEEELLRSRHFIRAIQLLMGSPKYQHNEVVGKLRTRGGVMQKKSNYKEYIYQVEEFFNRGNSIRRIIYENTKKAA